jgi:hypothetical protein
MDENTSVSRQAENINFSLIDASVPLQCHQCSTATDFNCSDPFYTNASRTVLKTNEYLADCETFDNGTIFHSCQKIIQNISGITTLRYPSQNKISRM